MKTIWIRVGRADCGHHWANEVPIVFPWDLCISSNDLHGLDPRVDYTVAKQHFSVSNTLQ